MPVTNQARLSSGEHYFEYYLDTMVCCRCTKTGSCMNCICAKNRRNCNGCQPSMYGKCHNVLMTQSPYSSLLKQPAACPGVALDSNRADESLSAPLSGPFVDTCDQLQKIESLPDFHPTAQPNFTWGLLSRHAFADLLHKVYKELEHSWPLFCIVEQAFYPA